MCLSQEGQVSRKGAFSRHTICNVPEGCVDKVAPFSKRPGVSQKTRCYQHGGRKRRKIEHSTLACLWHVMLARDHSRQLYQNPLQRLTFGLVDPWLLVFSRALARASQIVRLPRATQKTNACLAFFSDQMLLADHSFVVHGLPFSLCNSFRKCRPDLAQHRVPRGPPPRVPIVGPPSKGRKIVLAFTKGSAKRNKRGVFVRFWGRPQVRWAHTRAQERPPPWSPTSPRTPQPLLKGSQTDSRKKGVSPLLYYYTWLQVDWGAAEFRSQRS